MKFIFTTLLLISFLSIGHAETLGSDVCKEKSQNFINKDQSQLFVQEKCVNNKKSISVFTQTTNNKKIQHDFKLKGKEIVRLDFSIIDIDKDGYGDVGLSTGVCGAGPNCKHYIYRYDALTKKLNLFFSSGYSELLSIDGYLIESGRSSAAAWEYHVYKIYKSPNQIKEQDLVMKIVVDADVESYDAVCKFFSVKSIEDEGIFINPPNQKWLKLCEVYGKNYYLVPSQVKEPKMVTKSQTLELKPYGASLKSLIPTGWKLLKKAEGDLNQDGYNDLAFVIQNTDSKNIRNNEEGLGRKTIDLNPRILAIYFRDGKSKQLIKYGQYDEFIILQDSPVMDEPFKSLEIDQRGILKISFHFWSSAGSWSTSDDHYKFRFSDKAFQLIGYDSFYLHRGSGEVQEHSINFLTRKMKISKGTIEQDILESVQWKKFKLKKLKTLQELKKPFEWHFMGIEI